MFTQFALYFASIALGDWIGHKIQEKRMEKLKNAEEALMIARVQRQNCRIMAELLKEMEEKKEGSMET